jgi:uroporphyrinogen decarboxylase
MTPILIKHLSKEPIGRFPVWMMRQAGRYLPSYRAIREKYSFWEMVTTPEIASEVSLLPLKELNVDAVIFFSDILTLPYGLGVPILMKESVGPVIEKPFADESSFSIFDQFDPRSHTHFVSEALQKIRAQLGGDLALLGFAGAPWTVACYLIEGSGKNGFAKIRQWADKSPGSLAAALEKLTVATLSYLELQIDSGAHAIQLFDTWISEMPISFFTGYYIPLLNRIFEGLRPKKVPRIYFTKDSLKFLPHFHSIKADLLSVDNQLSLLEYEEKTQRMFSLQGNLDPALLLGDEGIVRRETRKLVETAKKLSRPAVLNLGHGITPQAKLENARAFVDEARTLWI